MMLHCSWKLITGDAYTYIYVYVYIFVDMLLQLASLSELAINTQRQMVFVCGH